MFQSADLTWLKAALLTPKIGRVSRALVQGQISRYPDFVERFEQRHAASLNRQCGFTFFNGTSAIEMAPLGVLLADVDLDYLERFHRRKQRNADRLEAALGGMAGLSVPHLPPLAQRGGFYQGYPVQITQPGLSVAEVLPRLQNLGIEAAAYPFPLHHKLPIYTDLAYRQRLLTQGTTWAASPKPSPFDLPVTDALPARLILLSPRYLLHLDARQIHRLQQGFEQALADSPRSKPIEPIAAGVNR